MKEPSRLRVTITFTEGLLGTLPADPEIHSRYIASKAPDAATVADEVAAVGAAGVEGRSMTVFPVDEDGNRILYDYQLKGFFKDACASLKRAGGTESAKLRAHKKIIDQVVFVEPRLIPLELPEGACIGECQRPLRADTPQGARVALAHSEEAPAGTRISFDVVLFDESLAPAVIEWLDYGAWRGIGQWRNSGKGRFAYELTDAPQGHG